MFCWDRLGRWWDRKGDWVGRKKLLFLLFFIKGGGWGIGRTERGYTSHALLKKKLIFICYIIMGVRDMYAYLKYPSLCFPFPSLLNRQENVP